MQWTNDQPIYQQVRDHVVSLIIDDVLKSGDPIPSVRQMAVEGGVNPLINRFNKSKFKGFRI